MPDVLADAKIIPGVIQALIAQIHYDGPSGSVAINLRTPEDSTIEGHTLEYKIPRRRGRALPAFRFRAANETLTRPPRLARMLALAHKLDGVVRVGQVKDYAELARLAHVSSARIGQIVMLGQLAPSIQEHILWICSRSFIMSARPSPELRRKLFCWPPILMKTCVRCCAT